MNQPHDIAREATLLRLRQSREEIRRILDPPRPPLDGANDDVAGEYRAQGFPRSRTMRLLMSGRGIGTVGALVGGLVLARPSLAFKFIRMVPAGAVARMLVVKAIGSLRARN